MRFRFRGVAAGMFVLAACGGGSSGAQRAAVCVPTTCAVLGNDCGEVADGCGGTLVCGACTGGSTCGGRGVANVCGVPSGGGAGGGGGTDGGGDPVAGGATRWWRVLDGPGDDAALGVGADASDGAVLFAYDSRQDASVAERRRVGTGEELATTTLPRAVRTPFATLASGAFYGRLEAHPQYPVTIGQSVFTRPTIVRWDVTGTYDGDLVACPTDDHECVLTLRSVDPDGSAVVARYPERGPIRLVVLAPDGTETWSFGQYLGDHGELANVRAPPALDLGGHVLVAARTTSRPLTGAPTLQGVPLTPDGHTYVLSFDVTGRLRWARELAGLDGAIDALGATSLGTVVVLGRFAGEFAFAGTTLRGGGRFLVAIEGDGSPRWARKLAASADAVSGLTVHPSGLLAAVTSCGVPVAIEAWNLAGDPLWSRSLAGVTCPVHAGASMPLATTLSTRDVLVGLELAGSADLGKGTWTAQQRAAVFVVLAAGATTP